MTPRASVVDALLQHGPMTGAALARLTGRCYRGVMATLERLQERRVVVSVPENWATEARQKGAGRPRLLWEVRHG